jgi:hypothetical protein
MEDDILQQIVYSIQSGLGQVKEESHEFRLEAERQNFAMSKFMSDLSSKFFVTQNKQQADLNDSMDEVERQSAATNQNINELQSITQESVSLLSQISIQMKDMAQGIGSLVQLFQQNSGQSQFSFGGMVSGGLGLLGGAAAATAVGSSLMDLASIGSASASFLGGEGGEIINQNISTSTADILKTIRTRESNGDYTTPNKAGASSASGAYQFIDSTWQGLTKKYGIGEEYSRAMEAPPNIQDSIAAKYVEDILARHNNDVSWVPREWFAGPDGQMSEKEQSANRGVTVEGYVDNWLKEHAKNSGQNSAPEKDDSFAPQGTIIKKDNIGTNNYSSGGGGIVHEKQSQLAGIRKLPLDPKLKGVLEQAAAAAGVEVVVFSGGQPKKGSKGKRTGSTRHDDGNAADVYLTKDGKKLEDTNPQDKEIMAKFVSSAVAAGATGVGAGHDYMGPSNIHIGFGKQATWGGASWIKDAAAGVYNNENIASGTGSSTASNSSENSNPFAGLSSQIAGELASLTGFGQMGAGMLGGGMPMMGGMGMVGSMLPGIVSGLSSMFSGSGNGYEKVSENKSDAQQIIQNDKPSQVSEMSNNLTIEKTVAELTKQDTKVQPATDTSIQSRPVEGVKGATFTPTSSSSIAWIERLGGRNQFSKSFNVNGIYT